MKNQSEASTILNQSIPAYQSPVNKNVVSGKESQKRPRKKVKGKFLFEGDQKIFLRGVTYGTFKLNNEGQQFPDKELVIADFEKMEANNINSIRVYTAPPIWLLDLALQYGLSVMVGLPWEQHITFLDDRNVVKNIKNTIKQKVKSFNKHPAIICYSIGNEIPSSIVRWYGAKRIEKFLKELYEIVKKEDSKALVTYVNFPPTEYLRLPFLDLFCFNVYLEEQEILNKYLARLQNLSDEKPLILAEIGLDSQRNGETKQAEVLQWQIETVFKKGAAGVLVFSWTDEWNRGGNDILDWDFGLTTRERKPKMSLDSVNKAFTFEPHSMVEDLPYISVAVCSFNGSETIGQCLESLVNLNYPNYEVIVVNDGSTDNTPEIAKAFDCRLISTTNRGLSNARNTAWQEALGEIVVYIDDDAYADQDWLSYLAISFKSNDFAAVGGPNIPPLNAPLVAQCVAHSPGGPTHVLISDEEAEHIPGCNMAFKRKALKEVGGFDPLFRAAGDDVDICWKIMEMDWKIGFSPSAVVWHHRRNKISTYWKQQKGYGRAEALLETKWPQKFNYVGHLKWGGRLYSPGIIKPLIHPRFKVEFGTWGTGFFQSLYERDPYKALLIPLMPEWYVLIVALFCLSCFGFIWSPLLWFFPLAFISSGIAISQAIISTWNIHFEKEKSLNLPSRFKLNFLTCFLFLIQPLARLWGRLEFGLTLWRRRHKGAWALPVSTNYQIWTEQWKSTESWLLNLEEKLHACGVIVRRGNKFDAWDLEIREGLTLPSRILLAIEEHGEGNQLVRFRIWPRFSAVNITTVLLLSVLAILALLSKAWIAATFLGVVTFIFGTVLLKHSLPIIMFCLEELKEPSSIQ